MERIKVAHNLILKNINILKLIRLQIAVAYFPLHEPYQLRGIKKETWFKPVQEAEFIEQEVLSEGEKELRKYFNNFREFADPPDFSSESLLDEAAFQWKLPWFIPIEAIRDYFGEKVAIFFAFLQFYTK